MSMKEILQTAAQSFSPIAVGAMVCAWVFCSIFAPDAIFGVDVFFKILMMAFIGSGLFVVFYAKRTLSKRQMRRRRIIHFILLLGALSGLALAWDWIAIKRLGEAFFFWGLVIVVYIIINLIIYWKDKKLAGEMTARLHEISKSEKIISEERGGI